MLGLSGICLLIFQRRFCWVNHYTLAHLLMSQVKHRCRGPVREWTSLREQVSLRMRLVVRDHSFLSPPLMAFLLLCSAQLNVYSKRISEMTPCSRFDFHNERVKVGFHSSFMWMKTKTIMTWCHYYTSFPKEHTIQRSLEQFWSRSLFSQKINWLSDVLSIHLKNVFTL